MKERLTARKLIHLLLVLLVLCIFFTYRTWVISDQSTQNELTKDQICDLSHSSCAAWMGKSAPIASIPQLPVRAEHAFSIELNGGDQNVKPVKAWLEGRDMFMGVIPVNFEQGDDKWQAKTMVGSCTSPLMVWLLNIEWSNGERQQLALSVSRE